MSDELALLDATAQAELVRQRHVSPRELVDAAIARIERVNPQLNAVIIQRFEKARAEAAAPDLPDGPFRGVPFLLKDLICHSAGDPYHAGMRLLRELEWVERYDTYLAARFRAAGFVFLGRTNVPELGPAPTTEPVAYGPTRNPWDTSRSPGGSSGGSAAAVAAGLVPVAHANAGGGSIRIPSSECGLVGLKPSRGRAGLLERAHRAEDRSRRRRAHDLGDRRDGAPGERERLSPCNRVPARAHAAGGGVVGGGLRPPAHPDAPRAPAPPGRVRPGTRRSPARLHARRRLRRLHHALQRHRAAGHLAPALLERRRPPDRRPARRRLRARGPAHPRRGPARGRAPVERAPPARACVSRPVEGGPLCQDVRGRRKEEARKR